MQEKKKRDLRRGVWITNQKLHAALKGMSRPLLLTAIEESLQKRFEAMMSAYASFRRSSSTEDFHRMRIKFKRLRYAAELTEQVLGVPTKKQIARMRNLQKIMGEIHDLQTYMAAIVEWSGTRAPVQLQKEYDALMKAFNNRPGKFDEFAFRNRPKRRSMPV
jgi:CHAD domain-containing protein